MAMMEANSVALALTVLTQGVNGQLSPMALRKEVSGEEWDSGHWGGGQTKADLEAKGRKCFKKEGMSSCVKCF